MTDTEQLPPAAAPVPAPTLAAWQHAWVDGASWSDDEESDAEPDFRAYIPAA
ncbi:hypothetical protein [Streptomyces liangshanensis]|uniref:Uncharacterized protein n=1 Tax=Streptomyces liangshanensis TaxID=2717324 RepID=A0A6G9GY73_9ACTN|nr:hypothetical protein [Streptomyces liangshanensis]QIQ03233.1 hypothetical protein HA039_13645 [Streptomyces liangshanensis]